MLIKTLTRYDCVWRIATSVDGMVTSGPIRVSPLFKRAFNVLLIVLPFSIQGFYLLKRAITRFVPTNVYR